MQINLHAGKIEFSIWEYLNVDITETIYMQVGIMSLSCWSRFLKYTKNIYRTRYYKVPRRVTDSRVTLTD